MSNKKTGTTGGNFEQAVNDLAKGAKPRLKLSDFYFADKHAAGSKMPILLPSGEDSGEWLQVRGPDCDDSVKASRAFTRALFAVDDQLAGLKSEAEASKNWYNYNVAKEDNTRDLNIEFISEIVIGWSLDEEFNHENLRGLLLQFPGLIDQVTRHHAAMREELSAK
jgi:hypothetical protein